MTWLMLGVLAWALADLGAGLVRPRALRLVAVAALVLALFGAAGAWRWADWVVALSLVAAYGIWAVATSVTARASQARFALALLSPVLPVLTGTVLAGRAHAPAGLLGAWGGWAGVPGGELQRGLLVLGVVLAQVSTANVVVRLVLAQLRLPTAGAGTFAAETTLKGGRFIGPLERILLVLLGLAGQLTAGTLIAAAKGIIRFPELRREDAAETATTAEYVLVGTLASWAFAIVAFVLIR